MAHLLSTAVSLQELVRIISERRTGTILWELNDIRESKVETEILMEQLLHTAFTVYNVLYKQPQPMAHFFPSVLLEGIQFHVRMDQQYIKISLAFTT